MTKMTTLFPTDPAAEVGPVPSGFNWGAFLFAPLFLLWYGRFGTALIVIGLNLVLSLPLRSPCALLIAFPVALSISFHTGRRANEVAWETDRFDTYAAMQRSMLRWNIAGVLAVGLLVIYAVTN
jgi:hypothetical protein